MKKNKGITLIALVITIVVLLILAGVTIAMLTGENGIITQAKKADVETKREEAREKISVVLAGAQIDKQTKTEYNQDEYLDNYVKKYLPNIEIAEDEIGLNGYVFELDRSVPKLGNYIGEDGNLPPRIGRITVIEKTESTINVEVSAIRADGLKYRYSYKDHESTEYIQVSEIENNQYKFTGLTMIICDIKVDLVDGNKVVDTEEISVLLVDVNEDGVLKFGEVTWAEGKASVQVSTNTKYKIEYQFNNTTGTWNQLTGTQITNIPNGTTVYARLSTGTSYSNNISMVIVDKNKPILNYNLSTTEAVERLTITLTARDMETGIYSIITPSGEERINQMVATIDYSVNKNGDYIFMAKDNAGNISEQLKISINNIQIIERFEFTGEMQTFTVPKDGKYKFEVYGAQGQTGMSSYTRSGKRRKRRSFIRNN